MQEVPPSCSDLLRSSDIELHIVSYLRGRYQKPTYAWPQYPWPVSVLPDNWNNGAYPGPSAACNCYECYYPVAVAG